MVSLVAWHRRRGVTVRIVAVPCPPRPAPLTPSRMQLGHLANASEEFANAVECYEQAAGIAEAQGEMGMLKRINCHLGISRGNLSLDSHFEMLAAESAAR